MSVLSKDTLQLICNECGESVSENEKHHKYEEDALIVCDECHNYYKHDIGRTGG